ncbi:L,D-transpeptidase family protein [Catenovulum agarivorans]|uniref:L,D-transpeptidase family protein n=1 Tax=Catenovulum agarivorans TaxID=1172192 RepID=UPI0002DD505C|nr:L,D-transpeptidase family protein [Catenovulum agarivorans]
MRKIIYISLLIILVGSPILYLYARPMWVPAYQKIMGKSTVEQVVADYGADAKSRLTPHFDEVGLEFPPKNISLLAIKDEKILELWASDGKREKLVKIYPIKAASGVLGPKLREGDKQVPEGFYILEYLNPNSAFHLSMKLNYPNQFDLKYAEIEGRREPGTNIFIHGKAVSLGCLAMGDPAIEELFVLVSEIGISNVKVAIVPKDPRKISILSLAPNNKPWIKILYSDLTKYFQQYDDATN